METLPHFPTFKKLEITDKKYIEAVTDNFKAYSDFNFASLWNYDTESTIEWSLLNDNVVITFADYITGDPFLSFLGKNKILETTQTLLAYAKEHSLPNFLKLIPEEVIENSTDLSQHFTIQEDPDNHDYILSIDEYLSFAGRKFASKRKNLRKFSKLYPEAVVERLDLSQESVRQDIETLFHDWAKLRNVPEEDFIHELTATKRFIDNYSHFDYIAIGIRHNGKLIAYSLIEKGPQKFFHNHFLKTLTNYKGLFEKIDNEMAKIGHELGYTFVNIQQDLGLEGLRAAKQLGRPVMFLKKYGIEG